VTIYRFVNTYSFVSIPKGSGSRITYIHECM